MFPHHGIAPSLYGYGLRARRRPPVTFGDHSFLLRSFIRTVHCQFRPKYILLAGHSTGADHVLQLIDSEEGVGVDIDGVLSFGCNTNLQSCVLSAKLADLTSGNENEIIEAIREFGHTVGNLRDYITICEYMATGFQKFETDIELLKHFSIGIVKPFEERDWDQFPHWYRAAVERVPFTRFIFSRYELGPLDEILRHHLDRNVLGDGFREDTIVREYVSHIDLSDPELMLRHTLAVIEQIE
jgi:hypothetical protein